MSKVLTEMVSDKWFNRLMAEGRIGEAREYLSESGHSTADFDNLFASTVNRTLLQGYNYVPNNHTLLCQVDDQVKDFREMTDIRTTEFDDLDAVPEMGEYKATTMDEEAVTWAVAKYGKTFGVSWEMMRNDDLRGFRDITLKLGRAAGRTERGRITRYFSGDVQIYDGNNLFHAGTHGNAATTALAIASVETGILAMANQTDTKGNLLNISPKYLVTGPALQLTAQKIVTSEFAFSAAQANTGEPNVVRNRVQPVVLEGITSATAWFLVADPAQFAALKLGFLKGLRNPQTFRQATQVEGGTPDDGSWQNDGINFKVRHVTGSTCVDYRPLYRGNV